MSPAPLDALIDQSQARIRAGDWEGARGLLEKALTRAPTRADLARALGICLLRLHRGDAAAHLFEQLRASGQGTTDDALHLATAWRQAGRPDLTLRLYETLAGERPDNPRILFNLGNALRESGQLEEALNRYLQVLRHQPTDHATWLNLGATYQQQGRDDLAIPAYRLALDAQPDAVDAWLNLGGALLARGEGQAAADAWAEGLRACPGDPRLALELVHQSQQLCRWDRLEALQQTLLAARESALEPFALLALPGTTPDWQLRAATLKAAEWRRGITLAATPAPASAGRLHIGYLSADFNEHATAHLLAEILERHDRNRFLVTAYDWSRDDGSPMRARLGRAWERRVDLRDLDDAAAAARIRGDGVHILVDLKGYTRDARPGIPARRPAPIQVNWLGYPGTLGADWIDYLIADARVIPPEARPHYRERIVTLPHSYQPNDRLRPIAPLPGRAAAGLPETGTVLCAFHQPYKITPEVFGLWMTVLRTVPDVVLWLLAAQPWMVENLKREAAQRGVDPARLLFAPRLPLPEHLARLQLADLFLDTWPVNGHTTASEALWAGVPVLTCPGRSFASRVALSLVHAAGLPELAVASPAAYLERSLALARDPAARAGLRAKVAAARGAALFDTPGFTRHLEAAYREMWRRHARGEAPGDFAVAPE